MTALLHATGVSFRHGDREVLHDIDLSIFAGEMLALVGPNGSGKTSLVRLLLGLANPNGGTVTQTTGSLQVGYVPQRTRLDADVPATANEIVGSGLLNSTVPGGRKERLRRIQEALSAVGLGDRGTSRLSHMSGGQQQRVLIARAIVRRPALLVLDEPVAGVDADSQRAFHDVLHDQLASNTSVLLVSHELSAVADLVQRVVVLRNHRVEFDGQPEALVAQGISLGVHDHDLPVWLERP
jgi:zinc transport system ATP-binding protein